MAEPHACQETPGTGRCFVCRCRLGLARPVARFRGGSEESLEATFDALGDHPDDDPDDVRIAVLNRRDLKRRWP